MITILSPEELERVKQLQERLDVLRSVEKKIVDELRKLIYKIEKL